MPATAGRVRMPANNRVHSSAALQTHGIWQSAIGYDPYAPDRKDAVGGERAAAAPAGGENAYDSFQGLLALARIQSGQASSADEPRGACKRCKRVGHLSFQCRNFLTVPKEEAGNGAVSVETTHKDKGGGKMDHLGTDSDKGSDSDDDSDSDSDVDSEMERAIARKMSSSSSSKKKKKRYSSEEESDSGESGDDRKHRKHSHRHHHRHSKSSKSGGGGSSSKKRKRDHTSSSDSEDSSREKRRHRRSKKTSSSKKSSSRKEKDHSRKGDKDRKRSSRSRRSPAADDRD